MRRILFFLLLSCSAAFAQSADVYYEIFIRSFQDSDGDGIGDLSGATGRLDYLQELGVTGVWLTPLHPSPSYHGYDVTDYYEVHPDFGTLQTFQTFVTEAHARGIRVVMDLVVNHTSSEHPWFTAASAGEAAYRDYYLWSDEDPGWRGVSGAPAWHAGEQGYYLGLFWSGMPDLNFRTPAVTAEVEEIARFWLELGVDGFRLDAIQHIVESTGGDIRNTPETFAWVQDFEAFIKTVNPEAFVVGETWTDAGTVERYLERADLDYAFDYPLWNALMDSLQARNAGDLKQHLKANGGNAERLATFISNHDQIRPATSLSPLRREVDRLKLAAGLLLTLPGTPYLYYGEEIGLPNGPGERDEEKRTPMRWTAEPGGGFSEAEPWYAFSTDEPAISVAAQTADPDSLLSWYRDLVALRKAHALDSAPLELLESGRSVLAFRRRSESELLVLANLGNKEALFDLSALGAASATDLLSGAAFSEEIELAKLAFYVLELD